MPVLDGRLDGKGAGPSLDLRVRVRVRASFSSASAFHLEGTVKTMMDSHMAQL